MAKIVAEEQPEFLTLPDDSIIFVKIDDCSTKEVDGRSGSWTKLEFVFKITGIQVVGDGSEASRYEGLIGAPIWGSVPFRLTDSPDNRLKQWAEAILGVEVGVGFELDSDYFIGRSVRAITDSYEKRNAPVDSKGRAQRRHQVASLLPAGGNAPSQPSSSSSWGAPPPQMQSAGVAGGAQGAGAGELDWGGDPPF